MQDPEGFEENGGWSFLDQEAGDSEEEEGDSEEGDAEFRVGSDDDEDGALLSLFSCSNITPPPPPPPGAKGSCSSCWAPRKHAFKPTMKVLAGAASALLLQFRLLPQDRLEAVHHFNAHCGQIRSAAVSGVIGAVGLLGIGCIC